MHCFNYAPLFKAELTLGLSLSGGICDLRGMIPPMVVHPEKIDFRRFV